MCDSPKRKFTVGQLIALLAQYPVDMPITVDGYEAGVTDFLRVMKFEVIKNAHKDVYYYGPHEVVYDPTDEYLSNAFPNHTRMTVINIGRH